MRTFTCIRQFTEPAPCRGCSFVCHDGDFWLLPIDPTKTEVIFDEDAYGNYVITLRKKT